MTAGRVLCALTVLAVGMLEASFVLAAGAFDDRMDAAVAYTLAAFSLLGSIAVLLGAVRVHSRDDDDSSDDGGLERGDAGGPPQPPWWPEFERQFEGYVRSGAQPRTDGIDHSREPEREPVAP